MYALWRDTKDIRRFELVIFKVIFSKQVLELLVFLDGVRTPIDPHSRDTYEGEAEQDSEHELVKPIIHDISVDLEDH